MNTNQNVISELARRLHTVWLKRQISTVGDAPKFKVVPEYEGRKFESFRGQREGTREWITELRETNGDVTAVKPGTLVGCRISNSGALEQNIVQSQADLTPMLMEQLNGQMAVAYMEGLAGNTAGVEETASKVHDIWREKCKSWASPALMVDFDDLPEIEKERDRDVAEAFNQYMEELQGIANEPAGNEGSASPTERQLGDIVSRERGDRPPDRHRSLVKSEIANDPELRRALCKPLMSMGANQQSKVAETDMEDSGIGI